MQKSFWRILLALFTAGILYLSLTPTPPSDGTGWDKANHALAMALLTLLAYRAVLPYRRAILFGGAYAVVVGGLVELLQGGCTVTRSAEWRDFVADLLGSAVAVMLLRLLQRRRLISQ
jgi:VanZ family protein